MKELYVTIEGGGKGRRKGQFLKIVGTAEKGIMLVRFFQGKGFSEKVYRIPINKIRKFSKEKR